MPNETVEFFRPSRKYRRALSGRCVMCTLGVVSSDLTLALFETETGHVQRIIHTDCIVLLKNMIDAETTRLAQADPAHLSTDSALD